MPHLFASLRSLLFALFLNDLFLFRSCSRWQHVDDMPLPCRRIGYTFEIPEAPYLSSMVPKLLRQLGILCLLQRRAEKGRRNTAHRVSHNKSIHVTLYNKYFVWCASQTVRQYGRSFPILSFGPCDDSFSGFRTSGESSSSTVRSSSASSAC